MNAVFDCPEFVAKSLLPALGAILGVSKLNPEAFASIRGVMNPLASFIECLIVIGCPCVLAMLPYSLSSRVNGIPVLEKWRVDFS